MRTLPLSNVHNVLCVQVCEGYAAALDSSQQLERKLGNTTSLTHDEILQVRGGSLHVHFTFNPLPLSLPLCPSHLQPSLSLSPSPPSLTFNPLSLQLLSTSGSSLPLPHQQALARRRLKQLLAATHRQIKLYACIQRYHSYYLIIAAGFLVALTMFADIAENLLYVLWRHLQFYLVHCKPVGGATELGVGGVSFSKPAMRRLGGQSYLSPSLFLPPLLLSFHFPHSVDVATCIIHVVTCIIHVHVLCRTS